jgi:hypothetical protein
MKNALQAMTERQLSRSLRHTPLNSSAQLPQALHVVVV